MFLFAENKLGLERFGKWIIISVHLDNTGTEQNFKTQISFSFLNITLNKVKGLWCLKSVLEYTISVNVENTYTRYNYMYIFLRLDEAKAKRLLASPLPTDSTQ
jgi:hypothetical protein